MDDRRDEGAEGDDIGRRDGSVGTADRAPWSGQQGWHVADWGSWGWAETVVKLVGLVLAFAAAIDDGGFDIADGHSLSHWLIVFVAVGYTIAVLDRLADREVIAAGFVLLMVAGHWALVYALGRPEWPRGVIVGFCGLMIVGDLFKLGFFATTRASVRGLPWTIPVVMTSSLVIAYIVAAAAA